MEQIAVIAALIVSIVFHEAAHGYAANSLGDPTARLSGRLSLNPLVHIDLFGSIVVPALLYFSHAGILFGWAKPVPYNPYNLRNQKWGEALVAAAGPAANILIAIIFAVIIRMADPLQLSTAFISISAYIVYINLLLALFNLLPFPPLDGSKILMALLPFTLAQKYRQMIASIEQYGFVLTFVFIFVFINIFWAPFSQLIGFLFVVLTGAHI